MYLQLGQQKKETQEIKDPMAETKKQKKKMKKVMKEYKEGKLHEGSKKGPLVKNPKQAIAIGLSEAKISKKK